MSGTASIVSSLNMPNTNEPKPIFSVSVNYRDRMPPVAIALELMDFVGGQPTPLRASDAAAALNLSPSTTHHMFVESGCLRREPRRYQLSWDKLATLSARRRRDIPPLLTALEITSR